MEPKFSPGQGYQPKKGFAQAARWIALDPDKETFIYRRFGELAARNLMYLQSELLVLENKLDQLDINDAIDFDANDRNGIMTWEILEGQFNCGDKDAIVRMDLIVTMRAKLKEYRELEAHHHS